MELVQKNNIYKENTSIKIPTMGLSIEEIYNKVLEQLALKDELEFKTDFEAIKAVKILHDLVEPQADDSEKIASRVWDQMKILHTKSKNEKGA